VRESHPWSQILRSLPPTTGARRELACSLAVAQIRSRTISQNQNGSGEREEIGCATRRARMEWESTWIVPVRARVRMRVCVCISVCDCGPSPGEYGHRAHRQYRDRLLPKTLCEAKLAYRFPAHVCAGRTACTELDWVVPPHPYAAAAMGCHHRSRSFRYTPMSTISFCRASADA